MVLIEANKLSFSKQKYAWLVSITYEELVLTAWPRGDSERTIKGSGCVRPVFGMVEKRENDLVWQFTALGQHDFDYDDVKSRWLIVCMP